MGPITAEEQFLRDEQERLRQQRERSRMARGAASVAQPSNPEQAARARRLSQALGLPAPLVQTDVKRYEQEKRTRDAADASRDPRVGDWLSDNADIVGDDIERMIHLRDKADKFTRLQDFSVGAAVKRAGFDYTPGAAAKYRKEATPAQRKRDNLMVEAAREPFIVEEKMKRGWLGQAAGSIRAGVAESAAGLYGLGAAAVAPISGEAEDWMLGAVKGIQEYASEERGRSTSFVVDSVYGGVESIPESIFALFTGATTLLGLTGGRSYVEGREGGLGYGSSLLYGGSQGGIEYLTEKIPVGALQDMMKGRTPAGTAIKRFVIGDMVGEQAATHLQDFNQWATLNPEKPFAEYIAERPEAAARTAIGTVVAGGPQAGIAYGMQRAFARQAGAMQDANRMAALDELIGDAKDNPLAKRDPDAFRSLLRSLTGDGADVYVPASVIAQFNQDYHDDPLWRDYADDIDDGLASGGEVAIPASDLVAGLADREDAWNAIRGDIRTSPSGQTLNEIEEANAALEELKMDATREADASDRKARREAAPAEKLRQGIRERLMNTGMTPDVATANAEIVAALFETEAANLGRPIVGDEFDTVRVQRVLPELLKPERADELDLVINAMREGGDPEVGVGETLLEFIKKRGGINDVGGDLKSMGVPARLLRDYDPAQSSFGGVSGEGDYGVDSTLRAAIEAGFFPELSQVEAEAGPSTLDTQVLLDALAEEAAGRPVYAETREDTYRRAGAELRELLSDAGVDPDTASVEDIRAAVERLEGGREFEQSLPEKIDIDGVERWTVNSEGQPLAATEEGVRAFWAWFGDSKVVDAEGKPLVVYHGTTKDIEQFDRVHQGFASALGMPFEQTRYGSFFSPDRSFAESYSDQNVVAVYLNSANQFDMRDDSLSRLIDTEEGARIEREAGISLEGLYQMYEDGRWEEFDNSDLPSALEAAGFDGAIMHESDDNGDSAVVYVAFSPEQIKSVNNRGTFDPNDARILYQGAPGPEGSDAFRQWAGTDAPVIEPDEINDFDFRGQGPFVMRGFHGTTHEFEAFDASVRGNREGQFGAVNYFSSSEADASGNYGADGTDLTSRIEQVAERRVYEIEQRFEEEGRKETLQALYDQTGRLRFVSAKVADMDDADAAFDAAKTLAEIELKGGQERTLEVFIRTEKPFVVGDENSPFIEFTDFEAVERQAIERVADDNGVTVEEVESNRDDYEDEIDDARWEIEAEMPNALSEAVQKVADRYDLDAQDIYGELAETVDVEGTEHNRLEDILRQTNSISLAEDPETGDLIGYQVLAEIIEELGFDSIVMKNADVRFNNMGIEPGTAHIHVFDNHRTNIKSVDNKGTFDREDPRILYQSAFHGSPHLFDKFSLDAIGTGEGAQAYGWGLYFAGKKEVAEHYRETLSREKGGIREVMVDGKPISKDDRTSLIAADLAQLVQAYGSDQIVGDYGGLEAWVRDDVAARGESDRADQVVAAFNDMLDKDVRERFVRGRLYEVEIPEDNEFLLWDAGFWEQPESVLEALEKALPKDDIETLSRGNSTGETIYDFMARKAVNNDFGPRSKVGDRFASLALRDAGIAGIKYLDGTSRDKGDGSYNYVVFDDNAVSIRAYQQNRGNGPQGQIQFTDAGAIIKLFESANLSTFQHEIAHFWLERFKGNAMQAVATDGNEAARQTFADWETLKAWFAREGHPVAEDGTIPTEAHEMFARGWERYLMEGKAPSSTLSAIFRKFSRWLRGIYRSVKALNSPITPEVREVMDRMLATQDQIEMHMREQEIALMFDNAVDAGMSEADARKYQSLSDQVRSEAEEKLYDKAFRAIRAREQKQWREDEKLVRERVTAEVEARPPFAALGLLRSPDGPRLDKDWLRETQGEDIFKILPAGLPVWRDGGDNADMIAERVGLRSGDELVRELVGLEATRREMKESGDKRSVKKATIDFETAQEMNERYGDPFTDGTIEREAMAAVRNERNGERLEMELRALASRSNRKPTPYRIAQGWARERIAKGVVADNISGKAQYRYAQVAAKAGRDAQAAFARGDDAEAFRHKQTEMLHDALVREAAKASERVDAAVKRLGKLAEQKTVKSMDQEYLERIHGLLEGYEFKRKSQRAIDARDAYHEWAQLQTAAGHDVVAVERLAQAKNWSRMTVDELLALDEAVKQLAHLGRHKQSLIDGKNKRDFEEVVSEAIAQTAQLPQKPVRAQFGGDTAWQRFRHGLSSVHAKLVKMEEVFDHLDNETASGVFNRVVYRPIVNAQANEKTMLDDMMGRLLAAMNAVPKKSVKRWQERRTILELPDPKTGEPATFLGEELLVMAMNMGNRGNMEKLIGGYGWDRTFGGIDEARNVVLEVLNRELSADDWRYVQTVWDTIDELWPEIRDLEKRVNGIAPERVEAVAVQTSAGELRGGYFPVVYDPESRVGERNLEVEERGLFPSNYYRSTTRSGSTRERTEFKGPLHLSLGVINRHVAEVVHDITHREVVMNADKFLSNDRVRSAAEAVVGPEVVKEFRPWLQHIANEWAVDREGNSTAEQWLKSTRTNATVVGLGFRFSTMMLQISGYSNSIERVGLVPVMRGIKRMMTSMEAWEFALGESKELRSRMATMDRDIRDNARKLASRQKGVIDAAQQFAFHGIGYMDRLVSVGTWLGAYDKEIAQGKSHDDAIYEADKAIRQSQGAGAAKDLARVQRGSGKMGEAWKLATMFYSYSSAFYQRQYRLARQTNRAIDERDLSFAPEFAARFLWLFIVPALLSEWLAGRGPEEDEDLGAWALGHILAAQTQAIPFARELSGSILSGFEPSYTPADGILTSAFAVTKDVERVFEGEDTKRATRNFLELLGYATGKVPGQVASTTQFMVDVAAGDARPDGASEWWEGISKGRISGK